MVLHEKHGSRHSIGRYPLCSILYVTGSVPGTARNNEPPALWNSRLFANARSRSSTWFNSHGRSVTSAPVSTSACPTGKPFNAIGSVGTCKTPTSHSRSVNGNSIRRADEGRTRHFVEPHVLGVLPAFHALEQVTEFAGGGDDASVLAGNPFAGVFAGEDHVAADVGPVWTQRLRGATIPVIFRLPWPRELADA
jgi:hypothetical protein